jgi:hypothetical protein
MRIDWLSNYGPPGIDMDNIKIGLVNGLSFIYFSSINFNVEDYRRKH